MNDIIYEMDLEKRLSELTGTEYMQESERLVTSSKYYQKAMNIIESNIQRPLTPEEIKNIYIYRDRLIFLKIQYGIGHEDAILNQEINERIKEDINMIKNYISATKIYTDKEKNSPSTLTKEIAEEIIGTLMMYRYSASSHPQHKLTYELGNIAMYFIRALDELPK